MILTMLNFELSVCHCASETIATTSRVLEQQQVTKHAVGQGNRTPASCPPAGQELP